MGGFIGAVIGAILAAFGFLVMRNPMRLAVLASGARVYHQRMVLDTTATPSSSSVLCRICRFLRVVASEPSGMPVGYELLPRGN